jgi:hypothetical protein
LIWSTETTLKTIFELRWFRLFRATAGGAIMGKFFSTTVALMRARAASFQKLKTAALTGQS